VAGTRGEAQQLKNAGEKSVAPNSDAEPRALRLQQRTDTLPGCSKNREAQREERPHVAEEERLGVNTQDQIRHGTREGRQDGRLTVPPVEDGGREKESQTRETNGRRSDYSRKGETPETPGGAAPASHRGKGGGMEKDEKARRGRNSGGVKAA